MIVEGDVAFGSSRELKHDIVPVDARELLAKVSALPIHSWRYKEDPLEARHVGPMAEDLHASFGLGRDDKHVSPGDTAGVTLAAVQALAEEVARLAAANDRLRLDLERLQRDRELRWPALLTPGVRAQAQA
jgi:hypothetical protein